MTAPSPETLERERDKHIPAWVDRRRLMRETCRSDEGIDAWIRSGVIPPGKMRGGKLLWKWETVDAWLEHGGDPAQTRQDNDPVVAAREAMRNASRR